MNSRQIITSHIKKSIKTKQNVLKTNCDKIVTVGQWLVETYSQRNGTVYLFGNGGSSLDAQHIAEELISAYRIRKRRPLSAHALSDNGGLITAIGNDYGFEYIFARQIEAMATQNDLVIALSTSGNSLNVIRAVEMAKKKHVRTVGLTGKNGGKLARIADIAIVIPSDSTAHIQECHIMIAHALCEVLEQTLFDTHF